MLHRVLLHLPGSRRLAIKADDVYVLEADGNDAVVRRRERDARRLAKVSAEFERRHFHRVHNKWPVNLKRVRAIQAAARRA